MILDTSYSDYDQGALFYWISDCSVIQAEGLGTSCFYYIGDNDFCMAVSTDYDVAVDTETEYCQFVAYLYNSTTTDCVAICGRFIDGDKAYVVTGTTATYNLLQKYLQAASNVPYPLTSSVVNTLKRKKTKKTATTDTQTTPLSLRDNTIASIETKITTIQDALTEYLATNNAFDKLIQLFKTTNDSAESASTTPIILRYQKLANIESTIKNISDTVDSLSNETQSLSP